jgi:single-strand DNA-binding protein
MARSLNKVTLIGNTGSDPDVRTTASGSRVGKLSLATSRSFQDRSGQQQERTQWHRLTFFGRLVDVVEQWVKKGDRLYVEGRLEYSQTQDERGGTRYWTDIIVNEMIMLGSSGGGRAEPQPHAGGGGYSPSPPPTTPITEPEDDLPF